MIYYLFWSDAFDVLNCKVFKTKSALEDGLDSIIWSNRYEPNFDYFIIRGKEIYL